MPRDQDMQTIQASLGEEQTSSPEVSDSPPPSSSGKGIFHTEVVEAWAGRVGAWIERAPQPGSILFPLILVLILFFILIPVNGHTRLVWIWLTLTGNASFSGTSAPSVQPTQNTSSPVSHGSSQPVAQTPGAATANPLGDFFSSLGTDLSHVVSDIEGLF